MAEELRERASSFVNNHVDLWVTVEDDDTLVLAANDATALLRAAADWLGEDTDLTVADVHWECRSTEPTHTMRLALRVVGAAAVPPQRGGPPR
ncbi:hypothetical protein [Streptacidiphilus sp. P02-A3a]|uniref:hypothetical protein n=1 Tax=Streptacidiphilus sp. P02-A3a TaxID=2704468 RepID=UPI0015F80960|nr:hypothetical protein [Streptacidiphilus sp. P02-A3a]QMU70550.1 hypothetical protein GXP74_22455 [Streptacidiphilus sp. P02-A3a]